MTELTDDELKKLRVHVGYLKEWPYQGEMLVAIDTALSARAELERQRCDFAINKNAWREVAKLEAQTAQEQADWFREHLNHERDDSVVEARAVALEEAAQVVEASQELAGRERASVAADIRALAAMAKK